MSLQMPPHFRSLCQVTQPLPCLPLCLFLCAAPMPNRVYVYNLPYSVTNDQLSAHMATSGTVINAEVIIGRQGTSKGCALVTYETAEQASHAIANLNGSKLGDREMYLREVSNWQRGLDIGAAGKQGGLEVGLPG